MKPVGIPGTTLWTNRDTELKAEFWSNFQTSIAAPFRHHITCSKLNLLQATRHGLQYWQCVQSDRSAYVYYVDCRCVDVWAAERKYWDTQRKHTCTSACARTGHSCQVQVWCCNACPTYLSSGLIRSYVIVFNSWNTPLKRTQWN